MQAENVAKKREAWYTLNGINIPCEPTAKAKQAVLFFLSAGKG